MLKLPRRAKRRSSESSPLELILTSYECRLREDIRRSIRSDFDDRSLGASQRTGVRAKSRRKRAPQRHRARSSSTGWAAVVTQAMVRGGRKAGEGIV